MSMQMNRREVLRHGSALLGAATLSGLPLSKAASQAKIRVRFAGYVESQEQLTQTLAVLKLYSEKESKRRDYPRIHQFRRLHR